LLSSEKPPSLAKFGLQRVRKTEEMKGTVPDRDNQTFLSRMRERFRRNRGK
jgi:hypothetical protein